MAELDAIWRAYSDRYPGLRSVVERTVRAVMADIKAEAREIPADCRPGFAARRGVSAPAPGPDLSFHGAPVSQAAETVSDNFDRKSS